MTQQTNARLRLVKALAARTAADFRRCLLTSSQNCADSRRTVKKKECESADAARRVPHVLRYEPESQSELLTSFHTQGIRSFSMTLGELTLSDTYHIETVQPLAIEAEVAGKLLDYPFRFLVEETSQQDMIQTVKGTYSRDKLLYTAINVCVEEANVSYYAEGIADALGLALDFRCDDFIPSQNFEESGMTYQDFIAALFGWTAKLPHRQVNVFIRGDTLHIIQRGQENAVTDITDWPHTRPTIDRRLIRSLWHSGRENESDQAHSDAEDAPVPFTGTISLGEISRTYENGFLVRETNENGATDYTYTDGYLTRKRMHNKDGSTSLTEYAYAKTGRDIYLFKETEHTTEAADDGREHDEYDWQDWNNPVSERVTYHAPLGMGGVCDDRLRRRGKHGQHPLAGKARRQGEPLHHRPVESLPRLALYAGVRQGRAVRRLTHRHGVPGQRRDLSRDAHGGNRVAQPQDEGNRDHGDRLARQKRRAGGQAHPGLHGTNKI